MDEAELIKEYLQRRVNFFEAYYKARNHPRDKELADFYKIVVAEIEGGDHKRPDMIERTTFKLEKK